MGAGMMLAIYTYETNKENVQFTKSWFTWLLLPILVPLITGYVIAYNFVQPRPATKRDQE